MVSTLEQMQVPNGTGPGVRRSKRPLLASRTRCNVLWKPPKFGNKVKIGNKVQFGNKFANWCNVWSVFNLFIFILWYTLFALNSGKWMFKKTIFQISQIIHTLDNKTPRRVKCILNIYSFLNWPHEAWYYHLFANVYCQTDDKDNNTVQLK